MSGIQENQKSESAQNVNQPTGTEKKESNIPYGYCHCGCGQKTTISTCTNRKRGRIKGLPMRYVQHHQTKHGINRKHGQARGNKTTKLYRVWDTMKGRCYNPNHAKYKYYGARGIKICDRWRYSFSNFYNDMGEPPYKHSIDRIDNNGDYEPNNCRWATYKEQRLNQRPQGSCF